MANRYTGAHRDLENAISARAYLTRELGEDERDLLLECFWLEFVASPEEVRNLRRKQAERFSRLASPEELRRCAEIVKGPAPAPTSPAHERAFVQAVARAYVSPGAVKAVQRLVRQARALDEALKAVEREDDRWLEILAGSMAVTRSTADTILRYMLATYEPLFPKPKRPSRAKKAKSETQKLARGVADLGAVTAKTLAAAAVANGAKPPRGQVAAARLCKEWENRLSRCRRAPSK